MYELHEMDCRLAIPMLIEPKSIHCCVTSPPYFGLRDYGHADQIGLEPTPDEFVAAMVEVFRLVRDVLRDDGTLWLNLGDSWSKNKQLLGIPWRVAFALQADGWILRQEIIWHKPNVMPEPVKDRCGKGHEHLFLFAKSYKYFFDHKAIKEPSANPNTGQSWAVRKAAGEVTRHGLTSAAAHKSGGYATGETRNRRSVWTVNTSPFKGAHFATYPPALIEPCILAGCPIGGTVLDPFGGAGTTALVAERTGRNSVSCELNPEYADIMRRRLAA